MSLSVTDLVSSVVSTLKGSQNQWGDSVARAQAKDAGIEWELPEGDQRSAKDIIDKTPLLKNLGNQSGVKDKLKERVGDFDTDPNAAYRAKQVLEHIEQLDESGNRVASTDSSNGRVDGFTKSGQAKHGTEAGRLQDFGKYGFENLKGELKHIETAGNNSASREKAEALGIKWERPEGNTDSAQHIIDNTPLLKNLGNQSGVKDALKQQVGDFENDPDAAFRAKQVLEHIVRFDESGNRLANGDVTNSSIDGFTKSGEAKHGTEAGRLQDFGKGGFDSLHGKLESATGVGADPKAREQGEKAGIVWELPKDDKRSAQDIIDANPLLKHLGNQSGVKDALKERVGDFENDPNAAFRAGQVLDRVVGYDENGKVLSGNDVANDRIDGFTKGGEAKHGTEAGRLQDFGKYGFESLPKAQASGDIASYKDFLKTNPNADEGSKKIAQYAAILEQQYDSIRGKTGAGDALTQQNIKDFKDANPQFTGTEKEALDFFSQPGAFKMLDTASSPLAGKADGKANKADIQSWLTKSAPTDAKSLTGVLSSVVSGNVTNKVDTSKLGKDVFEHPDKYTAEQKAAVLMDLQNAQKLVIEGAGAGMWSDDYGKVAIANGSGAFWEPGKVLQDINEHMAILQNDKPTAEFLQKAGDEEMKALFDANPGLKESVTKTYEDDVKSGKALDKAWDKATKDAKDAKDGKFNPSDAMSDFYATAKSMQSMLGINSASDIQAAVGKSSHNEEFKTYYKDKLATGDQLRELLKTEKPEAAASAFTMEVAMYNATLDPKFTGELDTKLKENFNGIVKDNLFKDATFDTIKAAFGKDGGPELDEAKVRSLIDQVRRESPELLMNKDGTVATTDQVLAGFRGNWDMLRQGSKTLDKMDLLDPKGDPKGAYASGTLHAVSGLFLAGMTIARGVQGSGKFTERNIVDITAGSIQTATVVTEGGAKAYQQYMDAAIEKGTTSLQGTPADSEQFKQIQDNLKDSKNAKAVAKQFEESAKGLGGLAGIAAGAYGIFDGVQAIRRGDNLTGGFGITAGSLGVLAGAASSVEGGLGVLGATVPRLLPILAGGLGFLAAGVAVLGALIPGLVKEGQQQARQSDFAQVLGGSIERYGIDGVKDGTISDIPTKDWPGGEDSTVAS